METAMCTSGLRRALVLSHNPAKRRITPLLPRRYYATPSSISGGNLDIRAAPPIRFTSDRDQFARSRAEASSSVSSSSPKGTRPRARLLDRIRIMPASPSYFTATPRYTDDLLYLSSLVRRHKLLPRLPAGEAPSVGWKTWLQYKTELGEPVRQKAFSSLIALLKRLRYIHPSLMPREVELAMLHFRRRVQPHVQVVKPGVLDALGRMRAVGRRKSSHAVVWLVEGEGEVLVNGRTLTDYFGRLHDRESALWALHATQRMDKYNVWAVVKGGGTTGQAEAITLGVAKALMMHEPALKPALRQAGTVTRDSRVVERKKHGKLKARKMPAWVKR